MFELKGRTALVTGASRRLGKATALALARRGMNIVVHYHRSEHHASKLVRELKSMGVESHGIEADLSAEIPTKTLISRAFDTAGSIDVLINNASIFPSSHLLSFSYEALQENVHINAFAPIQLSREFARHGKTGVVINFLDSRMNDYDKEHAAYHLSKRMLFSATRMLALELAPKIRVNAVAPGLILPPPGEDDTYLKQKQHTLPLEMHGHPTHIAETVIFLISNDFVTGEVIYVDGGRHMRTAVYG